VLVLASERVAIDRSVRRGVSEEELAGAKVEVIPLPPSPLPSSSSPTPLESARLRLPELLPLSVRKLLYVDTDTLLLADPTPIVDAAFEGEHITSAIGVARRSKPLVKSLNLSSRVLEEVGLTALPHHAWSFNAGVMLMNLDVWRSEGLMRGVLQLADRLGAAGFRGLPGMSTSTDSQSAIALFLQNSTKPAIQEIPPAWNVDGLGWKVDQLRPEALCSARILHWSGQYKPWMRPYIWRKRPLPAPARAVAHVQWRITQNHEVRRRLGGEKRDS